MSPRNFPALAAHELLASKLRCWLANMLVILLNLVGDLVYQLQWTDCDNMGEACVMGTTLSLVAYAVLFILIVVWHVADLVPQSPQYGILQVAASPTSFSLSLIALVGAQWAYQATTIVDYYGYFDAPLPLTILTYGLFFLVPILVLGKLLWAAYFMTKAGLRLWRRGKLPV